MADREDIAYKSDLDGFVKGPSGATPQKIAVFGSVPGTIEASTVSISDVPTGETIASAVSAAVNSATLEIWNAINGVDAIQAYGSEDWESGKSYEAGDFCLYKVSASVVEGYKCLRDHTSSQDTNPHEDDTDWSLVLTSDGYNAISEILSRYSASLLDLAPDWSSSGSVEYKVGQLAVKDGVLQICTVAGRGVAATFSASGANVDASISNRISDLDTALRALLADKASVDRKADASTIDAEYDTSSSGYAVGDTCTHGGKWYKCSTAVSTGAAWNASSWHEITVKEAIASGAVTQEQADWAERDDTKASYIKNKPTIPEIDDTLSHEGEAADAKAVGDAIEEVRSDMASVGNVHYEIKDLIEVGSSDPKYDDAKETYRLLDRTVNVIRRTINNNKNIALIPPAVSSASTSNRELARDFYVVLLVDADNDVEVSMTSMSLKDCNEGSVTLFVPKGEHVTYRFTDADENHSVFLVTLFADPAVQKVRQIEKALDHILNGEGIYTPSSGGILIYNVTDGKYHRMVAVTDEETGDVNISVDKEGTDL